MRTPRPRSRSVLCLVPVLAGCMIGPPGSEISERRNAACAYVLTQRAFALSLAKGCRLDPAAKADLTGRAQAALESWEQRNRTRLDAASRYFEDYLAVVARREGRRKSIERRDELTKQYTTSGTRAAQTSFDQAGGRGGCPSLLESLAAGSFDLQSIEFVPVVDELVAKYATDAK